MKKLILIRHAEAGHQSKTLTDFGRTLTPSGKQDAAKMAILLNRASVPQVIISSPALRALTTAQIFTATLGLDDAGIKADIYEATADTLLRIVNHLDDRYQVIALVGHNPGVSNFLHKLSGKITTMPTASFVEIALEVESWAEVSGDLGTLIRYQYP